MCKNINLNLLLKNIDRLINHQSFNIMHFSGLIILPSLQILITGQIPHGIFTICVSLIILFH